MVSKLVKYGVLTLRADPGFCSKDYLELTDWAENEEVVKSVFKDGVFDLKAYVMPNCVDAKRPPAWAEIAGNTTWMKARYAFFPVVQVHEIGHNLGLGHSGNSISNYGDGTDYMGNKAKWDNEGNKMCFNAAKIWYLDWYTKYNQLIYANEHNSGLIHNILLMGGVADAKRGSQGLTTLKPKAKLVVSVRGGEDEGDEHLYMMFNRAKGVNEGVVHDKNKVVIVKQRDFSLLSERLAALNKGQSYSYQISKSKIVTIKVTNIIYSSNTKNMDYAYITLNIRDGSSKIVDGENLGNIYIEDKDNSGNWRDAFDDNPDTQWEPGRKEVDVWYGFDEAPNHKVTAYFITAPLSVNNYSLNCQLDAFSENGSTHTISNRQTLKFNTSNRTTTVAVSDQAQGLFKKYKLNCKREGENTGKFKAAQIGFKTDHNQSFSDSE